MKGAYTEFVSTAMYNESEPNIHNDRCSTSTSMAMFYGNVHVPMVLSASNVRPEEGQLPAPNHILPLLSESAEGTFFLSIRSTLENRLKRPPFFDLASKPN